MPPDDADLRTPARHQTATDVQPLCVDHLVKHYRLPGEVDRALQEEDAVRRLSRRLRRVQRCIITARGYNFATALEAALKLKETAHIAVEAAVGGAGRPCSSPRYAPSGWPDSTIEVGAPWTAGIEPSRPA